MGQLITIFLALQLVCSHSWIFEPRNRVMGEQISLKTIVPRYRRVQERVTDLHNRIRAHVHPPAANMLMMKWDRSAARAAQKWANGCHLLEQSPVTERWIDHLGDCGQNIFVSTERVPWLYALRNWYQEKDTFVYGSNNASISEHGHYLQMVWATSHKVGCGLSQCEHTSGKKYYSYVCNYCPVGNDPTRRNKPYRRGKSCSACPNDCRIKVSSCPQDEACRSKSRCLGPTCVLNNCQNSKCSTGRLCTNACPFADQWHNCKKIHKALPNWLCHSQGAVGRQRRDFCKATCSCLTLIH